MGIEYWKEAIEISAEECGVKLTPEQVECFAQGAMVNHENYGLAHYTPPASDRYEAIESEWKAKYKQLEREFDAYRDNAETAVKQALGQRSDTQVSIGKYGEVTRHGGRSDRIQ